MRRCLCRVPCRSKLISALLLLAIVVAVLVFSAALPVSSAAEVLLPVGSEQESTTLAEALDKARRHIAERPAEGGMLRIVVEPGVYELERPLRIDFPRPGSPWRLEISADKPRSTVLSAGRRISGWERVEDPHVLAELAENARGHVYQCDLTALGITDYGKPSGGGIELFFRDEPMTLARWPNEGFVKIADVLFEDPVDVRGTKGDRVGKFVYEGERPKRWTDEADPWVHGYWFWDWSDEHHPVASIDTDAKIIAVEPPYHSYGYRKGQWYYAYNLLCELDRPGEWYLDRASGSLFFWPPQTEDLDELVAGRPTVSLIDTLVRIEQAEHVTLAGFALEHARSTAIQVDGCRHVQIVDCRLRNIGGWGVRVSGGQLCGVFDSDLYNLGDGGIALAGGDRKSLTPGSHVAMGNDVHHYGRVHPMYNAGVAASGVGNLIAHNHIHHAPHQAIGFSGNEHTMVGNEIDHVCLESNDAGAIYAGRDWTQRGTVIAGNHFHDITGFQDRGCMGVYLDDMYCGTKIVGNLFRNVSRAAFIGGGRDNLVADNVFIDCSPATHVDSRAMGWASYHVDRTMTERLRAMPIDSPAWRSRYPELLSLLDDEPAAPKGNVITQNVAIGGQWSHYQQQALPFIHVEDNLVVDSSDGVGLVESDGGRFRFADEAAVAEQIPGFRPPDFDGMGLARDRLTVARRLVADLPLESPTKPDTPITRWESTIARLEGSNADVPKDSVVFIGSSSIVGWDLEEYFPELTAVNRGFGGSQINEVTYFAERILVPLRPRLIVFYAGDNGVAAGVSPREVHDRFRRFVQLARLRCPGTPIVFVAIKPSLARWHWIDNIREANRLVAEQCRRNATVQMAFLDIQPIMLGADGRPREELLREDGLHLSPQGYRLWSEALRPYLNPPWPDAE